MAKMKKEEVERLIQTNAQLRIYLEEIEQKMSRPEFYAALPQELKNEKYPNVLYPTKGPVFIHLVRTKEMEAIEYRVIEPLLNEIEQKKLDEIKKIIVRRVAEKKSVIHDADLREILKELLEEILKVDKNANKRAKPKEGRFSKNKVLDTVYVTPDEKIGLEYNILKSIIGAGPLECFMRDPYLEDIHFIPGDKIHLIHKIYDMIKTNIEIAPEQAGVIARDISEKMGTPVSEGHPIADGTLPDGSRGNIIYSDAISVKGPSMTIRRFTETPISITQLIKWGTVGSGVAAYLWICLQYGRSLFICGETACGKTTTMNAIIPFIKQNHKIFTAESTPELQVPHDVWQRLLTKTTGPKEGQVDLFDLLKSALRSRPDYIIPGEVRGPEGSIVFQAMQTGHPCISTFHAGTVTKVIQRFTGDPINVPKTFMDNLDIVIIQMAVEQKGKKLRRILNLDEIEGYNREVDGIMARTAFTWDPVEDRHVFKANRNSFVLEQKIAKNAGYADTAEIYDEYDKRKLILERLVEEEIFDYYEVTQCIWGYYRAGLKGLPVKINM